MWGVRPDKHLHILYFNVRSLCPKLDELHALCDIEKPEVVCITETWLCDDIGESEVSIGTDMVVGLHCLSLTSWNTRLHCMAQRNWNFCLFLYLAQTMLMRKCA